MAKKEKNTRKKTKIIGKQTYANRDTGEIVEMDVIQIEDRDANFHKLWMGHIVQTLDIIGNKKIKVINYIMQNINSENLFIMTQRQLAKEINVSLYTVQETLKALQESDFLKIVQNGVYRINPNVIFKGGKSRRMNILLKYQKGDEEEEQKKLEEKIKKEELEKTQKEFEEVEEISYEERDIENYLNSLE